MTNTAGIISKVESVASTISNTGAEAAGALDSARDLTEQAAAHGWEGVAANMQQACDSLEEVAGSLGTANDAAGEALGALRAINDQMSSPDVADHLGRA